MTMMLKRGRRKVNGINTIEYLGGTGESACHHPGRARGFSDPALDPLEETPGRATDSERKDMYAGGKRSVLEPILNV
jgi:hypothetical protein